MLVKRAFFCIHAMMSLTSTFEHPTLRANSQVGHLGRIRPSSGPDRAEDLTSRSKGGDGQAAVPSTAPPPVHSVSCRLSSFCLGSYQYQRLSGVPVNGRERSTTRILENHWFVQGLVREGWLALALTTLVTPALTTINSMHHHIPALRRNLRTCACA